MYYFFLFSAVVCKLYCYSILVKNVRSVTQVKLNNMQSGVLQGLNYFLDLLTYKTYPCVLRE